MADVNRGNRPLSPHMTIYKPQITSMMSIFHRITGVALTLGALLVVWWFLAAATGSEYFAFVDGLMTSILGGLILIGSAWALSYHALNGIRHLWWDTGRGFELDQVQKTGMAVAVGSVIFTAFILFAS